MKEALIEVYNRHGPRQPPDGSIVPPERFAALTNKEVDRWDFDDRFMMQRVARAIVEWKP